MFNEAHDIPPLPLEEREKRDNEWILPDEPEEKDRKMLESYNFKKKSGRMGGVRNKGMGLG
jgi:hypothetical protein